MERKSILCGNLNLKTADTQAWQEFAAEGNPPPSPVLIPGNSVKTLPFIELECAPARPALPGLGGSQSVLSFLCGLCNDLLLLQVLQQLGSRRPVVDKL